MRGIYFDEKYGRLYEKIENGICKVFRFPHALGTVQHMFIKREIPISVNGKTYYDIVTPYGYGGPLIENCNSEDIDELVNEFNRAFQEYCHEQDIISEFIRFQPVIDNARDFMNCYDVIYIRNTVGTNLKDYDDPVQQEFSKSTRKNIKKALQAGVKSHVTLAPENFKQFKSIYHETMARNNADPFYYFDDAYFERLLNYFGENMLLVEVVYMDQIIGMGLNYVYDNMIHTHISGTLTDFQHLAPAYIMQYALVVWGKENGIDLIHDGGGRTNSEDDSLYLFKKQFGKNTRFKFFVGKKIWDAKIYEELCKVADVDLDSDYFPAYRSKPFTHQESVQN